jgi:hypothetical protein
VTTKSAALLMSLANVADLEKFNVLARGKIIFAVLAGLAFASLNSSILPAETAPRYPIFCHQELSGALPGRADDAAGVGHRGLRQRRRPSLRR